MLLLAESFDDFNVVADMVAIGYSVGNPASGTLATIEAGGVSGGRCFRSALNATRYTADMPYKATKAANGRLLRSSFFMRSDSAPSTGSPAIVSWVTEATAWQLQATTTGFAITTRHGSTSSNMQGVSGVAHDGAWHHWEFEFLVSTTSSGPDGAVRVWIDGVLALDFTGNTTASSATAANPPKFAYTSIGNPNNSAGRFSYDDFMVWDDYNDGDGFTGRLGVWVMETLRPTAAGDLQDWTPSTGTNHAALLDDINLATDTDFLSSGVIGAGELNAYSDPSAAATQIKAVLVNTFAQAFVAGSGAIKNVAKSGAAFDRSLEQPVTTTLLKRIQTSHPNDPATGVAWTPAAVAAAQFGLEKAA